MTRYSLFIFLLQVVCKKPIVEAIAYLLKEKKVEVAPWDSKNYVMHYQLLRGVFDKFYRYDFDCYTVKFHFLPDDDFYLLISGNTFIRDILFGKKYICIFCNQRFIFADKIMRIVNGNITENTRHLINIIYDANCEYVEENEEFGCSKCKNNIPLLIEQGITFFKKILMIIDYMNTLGNLNEILPSFDPILLLFSNK